MVGPSARASVTRDVALKGMQNFRPPPCPFFLPGLEVSSFPLLSAQSVVCWLVVCPKTVGPPWTGTSKIVSQNKPLPLISGLPQVFVRVIEGWLTHSYLLKATRGFCILEPEFGFGSPAPEPALSPTTTKLTSNARPNERLLQVLLHPRPLPAS